MTVHIYMNYIHLKRCRQHGAGRGRVAGKNDNYELLRETVEIKSMKYSYTLNDISIYNKLFTMYVLDMLVPRVLAL